MAQEEQEPLGWIEVISLLPPPGRTVVGLIPLLLHPAAVIVRYYGALLGWFAQGRPGPVPQLVLLLSDVTSESVGSASCGPCGNARLPAAESSTTEFPRDIVDMPGRRIRTRFLKSETKYLRRSPRRSRQQW
jgi:hypothetical protein